LGVEILRLRIYRDDLKRRIPGALTGVGLSLFGYFAISESLAAPNPELAERALWYGITLMIAGVASFAMSWLAPDLSGIWCNSPRFLPRTRRLREQAEQERQAKL
jgi:hypothetical protein